MPSAFALARFRGRTKPIILIAIAVAIAVAAVLVFRFWPFTESSVRSRLAAASSAEVHFQSFHQKYLPPGCVAKGVSFKRSGSATPLIAMDRLVITTSLRGLFSHRVNLRAEGMHVILSRSDFAGTRSRKDRTTIGTFIADDATLEVPAKTGGDRLRFVFSKLELHNLGSSGPASFYAVFENPMPAGTVRTSGEFGPWNGTDASSTAVSGKYSLENGQLAVFHSIAGTLWSMGNFGGTFRNIHVQGSTNTPDFEVTSTHHKMPLRTQFNAAVNAINGEIDLQRVHAIYGRDVIDAHGSIASGRDSKRRAIVDLTCSRGRIEDTFYPFIHSATAPLTGTATFQMHVQIPSGKERFLKRIELKSQFQISDARFSNERTQTRVQKISEEPGQKQPSMDASVDLQGQVTLEQGVAHIWQLAVQDQEASAQLRGIYNLLNQRVDMHGKLETKASLTKTTSGIKALFAKVIGPFFKKTHNEKIVPVKITGTYQHPSFGLDLNSKM
ncbi:MAG TPA: AsmA-like C-terminal region-containing protein [Terriglobales bacterium]|nr:AsmA-like C-terminal region-containing protein [Terriglobales bacterium]